MPKEEFYIGCRWATRLEQANNMRKTKYLEIFGEKIAFAEACKKFGLKYSTVNERLKRGWDIEKALTSPLLP